MSCNYLNESKGNINEIIIVTSEEDKHVLKTYIDNMFHGYVNTPYEEKIYNTKWINVKSFKEYIDFKNIK